MKKYERKRPLDGRHEIFLRPYPKTHTDKFEKYNIDFSELKVVVDVGAYNGSWTVALIEYMKAVYPKVKLPKIWALEPVWHNFLMANLRNDKNTVVVPYGLASENGVKKFPTSIEVRGQTSAIPGYSPKSNVPVFSYCATWAYFLELYNVPIPIDLVKVDVEGMEHHVLGTICNGPFLPKYIEVEFHPDKIPHSFDEDEEVEKYAKHFEICRHLAETFMLGHYELHDFGFSPFTKGSPGCWLYRRTP